MAQKSALGLSGVMDRLRAIVAKAAASGSLRNITGTVTATSLTGDIALGTTNLTGTVALGSWNITGEQDGAGITGDIDYQE